MFMSVTEIHFTPSQIAEKWGVSSRTVMRIFEHEIGVLRIGSPETRFKRKYYLLRIPESVAERVYKRITGRLS
jgi:hypothetical protein